MTNYLSIKKILQDCIALYKKHVLYITVFISGVLIPYSLIVLAEELPDSILILVPLFIILFMMVEMVSISLVSTGYIEKKFILAEEFKRSFFRSLPYLGLTILASILTFIGINMFVIPGILLIILFSVVKIDFVVGGRNVFNSIKESINLLKVASFSKIISIFILPILCQFLFGFIFSSFINIGTLESLGTIQGLDALELEIKRIYPYFTAGIIIVYPIIISFRCSVYFNLLKEKQLKSSNELV